MNKNIELGRIKKANNLLRSVKQVADRKGVDTNWDALSRQLETELNEQNSYIQNNIPNVVLNFEEVARPMMRYLCENYHPHVTVIVTPTRAELLEGKMATKEITDYLAD